MKHEWQKYIMTGGKWFAGYSGMETDIMTNFWNASLDNFFSTHFKILLFLLKKCMKINFIHYFIMFIVYSSKVESISSFLIVKAVGMDLNPGYQLRCYRGSQWLPVTNAKKRCQKGQTSFEFYFVSFGFALYQPW